MANFPVPFSDYGSTHLDIDSQKRINLYPNSKQGLRQFPALVNFGNVTVVATEIDTYDFTSEKSAASGVYLSANGERLLIGSVAGSSEVIQQYSLSIPFDISAGSIEDTTNTYDVTATPDTPTFTTSHVYLTPDGTQLQYCLSGQTFIYYANLTIANDISTAVYTGRVDMNDTPVGSPSLTLTNVTGFYWADGNTLFFVAASEVIYKRVMSTGTAYRIDGRDTPAAATGSASDGATSPDFFGISISKDGLQCRVVNNLTNDVRILTFTTAFDVSTLVFASELGINGAAVKVGLYYTDADQVFYTIDTTNNQVEKFAVGGAGRGQLKMAGILYVVIGEALFSVSSTGIATSLGAILNQPEAVQMETDGTQLVITTGTTIYLYKVVGGLTTITDASINDTSTSSAYMDLRFHYQQPNGQFLTSALNDAATISALDFATAESFSDDIVRMYAHNKLLYLMGDTFSEIWKTTGVGRPPLARQQVIERGIIGKNAMTSIDNRIYFMDQERRVNVMSGAQYEPVESPGMNREIANYSIVNDAIFTSYVIDRENFIEINFPDANTSWTYHEKTGQWNKRVGINGNRINSIAYENIYGGVIALDGDGGQLYRLEEGVYLDSGNPITRIIDSALINSNQLGVPDQKLSIATARIRYLTSAPAVIDVSVAKDGDLSTFGTVISNSVTDGGVLTIHRFPGGVCRECVIRISTSSDAKVDILDLSIEATLQEDSND